jgi:hypothetical protein
LQLIANRGTPSLKQQMEIHQLTNERPAGLQSHRKRPDEDLLTPDCNQLHRHFE